MTSMPTLGQAHPALGEQPAERFVAHDEVGNRLSFGPWLAVGGGKSDEMDESVFIDYNFDVAEEKCWLHCCAAPVCFARKSKHHHQQKQSEIFVFVNCTVFVQNGFQAVSLLDAIHLRLTSCSRATPTLSARDRRPSRGGMVAPAPSPRSVVGHPSSSPFRSFVRSLQSVAGNRDSEGFFGNVQKGFGEIRNV